MACTLNCRLDPGHPVGNMSARGMKDVFLEAALTTIQDCEDSVAAVDAEDKVNVYPQLAGPDERRPGRYV